MILKKPYSFLIRHFKLIHIIMFISSCYLIFKTNNLMSFFDDYVNSPNTLIGRGTNLEYVNGLSYFLLVSVVLLSFIIFFLMKIKDKPAIFYIVSMTSYIITIILFNYDSNILKELEMKILDIRTLRLTSDLTFIVFIIQILTAIIFLIRGLGFNLKKFNFGKDLEFEVTEHDNEEFEFDLKFDKNRIKRKINKRARHLRYAYKENKFVINIIASIVLFIFLIFIYLNINYFNKVYKKNSIINTTEYTYNIIDSYILNKDYRGNVITNNYLVAIKLHIKNKTTEKIKVEPTRYQLKIGNIYYNNISNSTYKLNDIGKIYNGSEIKDESDILLVYEIPEKYKNKKMILKYIDSNDKTYKIRLNNIKFDKEITKESSLNNEIVISDKIYNNIKFKITNFDIKDEMKIEYTFCETKTNCSLSTEYIVPLLIDNYKKTVLKINSDTDISYLINMFGKIEYIYDGTTKYMETPINIIEPKNKAKNTYYFEIYDEIKNASSINLILQIRNNKYIYKLK